MNKDKLIYPELSYKITGILFAVHNELERFRNEKQYGDKNAIILEIKAKRILTDWKAQKTIALWQKKYISKNFGVNQTKTQLRDIYLRVNKKNCKKGGANSSDLPFREPLWLEEYRNENKIEEISTNIQFPMIIGHQHEK